MKSQKLVVELNNLLDSATKEQKKRRKRLKLYAEKVKTEEKIMRAKLKKNINKSTQRRLKKELVLVNKAYELIGL